MDRPHKLFISHSSKDADYVEVFVGLLEILGLRDEEIILSLIPIQMCIRDREKMDKGTGV